MIKFFAPMKLPTITAQEQKIGIAKNGKPYKYDPSELKAARTLFRDHLAKFAPQTPFDGPIRLETIWCYPCTPAHPRPEWKTTKPDTDNLVKMLKDVMTQLGYWNDDAQVTLEIIQKIWDTQSGLYVEVEKLT